ncbi:MAG: Hsp70 family protein [Kineosporiaceae bacterium]
MGKHSFPTAGLDFGTSTSLVAVRQGSSPPRSLPLGRTTAFLPSLVRRMCDGSFAVGEDADKASVEGALVRSIKRSITRGRTTVTVDSRGEGPMEVEVDELVVAILSEVRTRAAAAGLDLSTEASVRLGCPAIWTGPQRRRLRALAEAAGLGRIERELIDEPIAAGISWAWNRWLRRADQVDGQVLVFDSGGGTLDVAMLDVEFEHDEPDITVLSALGLDEAGDALDQAILADLEEEWLRLGVALEELDDPELAHSLARAEAGRAKVALSYDLDYMVRLGAPYDSVPAIAYSRERLEDAFEPQLQRALSVVEGAVRGAFLCNSRHLAPDVVRRMDYPQLAERVRYVLLAGGMSQIPAVARRLQEVFPTAEIEFDQGLASPLESVAAGLAISTAYSRLNLHRPGLDFVLEWEGASGPQRHLLYAAHTPLYERREVMSGNFLLGHRSTTAGVEPPTSRSAVLKVLTPEGEQMPLRIDTVDANSIPVVLDRRPCAFKLYVDGRILLRESDGRETLLRVSRWPVMQHDAVKALIPIQFTREQVNAADLAPVAVHSATWRSTDR